MATATASTWGRGALLGLLLLMQPVVLGSAHAATTDGWRGPLQLENEGPVACAPEDGWVGRLGSHGGCAIPSSVDAVGAAVPAQDGWLARYQYEEQRASRPAEQPGQRIQGPTIATDGRLTAPFELALVAVAVLLALFSTAQTVRVGRRSRGVVR